MDVPVVVMPDPPPKPPKPVLWKPVLRAGAAVVMCVIYLWLGTVWSGFVAGAMWCVAVLIIVNYVLARRAWKDVCEQVDRLWARVEECAPLIPPLAERYGPESAVHLVHDASTLVDEGDFPDVKAAIAALERHHDLEPTDFSGV